NLSFMAHTLNAPQPNHSNQVEIYRLGNESKTHSANLIALHRKADGGLARWTVGNHDFNVYKNQNANDWRCFARLLAMTCDRPKPGFCVSIVSIVCALKSLFHSGPRMVWTRAISIVADAADGADDVMESVLTLAVILIVRIPNRPSRPKTISILSVRRKLCARRSRPASARGLFGQPDRLAPICKRSDALPLHCALSAMISRTSAATGSASTMFSIAARRLFE